MAVTDGIGVTVGAASTVGVPVGSGVSTGVPAAVGGGAGVSVTIDDAVGVFANGAGVSVAGGQQLMNCLSTSS